MRETSMRWLSVLTACGCLFLIAGAASADRNKNKSKQGKTTYEYRQYENYRDQRSYDRSISGWSVGGSWGGRRGGVDVHVYGGSNRYPTHRYYDRDRRHYRPRRIPPGHLPPPGQCRVWLYDRPPGHQPPPTSCRRAEWYAYRYGGTVIYGGPRR